MFQLNETDKDIINQTKVVQRMQISGKDPFMGKPKQVWRSFHRPIATTEEIMESLEPYETRKITEGHFMDRFTDQERRYYRDEEEMQRNQSINNN